MLVSLTVICPACAAWRVNLPDFFLRISAEPCNCNEEFTYFILLLTNVEVIDLQDVCSNDEQANRRVCVGAQQMSH